MAPSWIPLTETGPRVTEKDVRRFEREFGHELPADYRAFLLDVNGGHAPNSHCVFTLRRGKRQDESVLNSLYSLNTADESDDLAAVQQQRLDPLIKLPEGVLEIGYDGFGSAIVLPLVGEHRGQVWYYDNVDPRPTDSNPRVEWFDRRDVWKLADSFAEFMGNLGPLGDSASVSP